MRLFADENIAGSVIAGLRKYGHVITTVDEIGLVGKSDEAILREAKRKRAAILTHDKDFSRLLQAAKPKPHFGLFLLRFRN